jgi:hypothetical protein
VQFARVPSERLPPCGFSAESFPQFRGARQHHDIITRHPAAAQKSKCGPMRWKPKTGCHHSASGSSQRYRKPLTCAKMTCKYLSLLGIRSKSQLSRPSFAAAFEPFDRKRVSGIAQSAHMRLKRLDFNAILYASLRSRCSKFTRQKWIQ